MCLILRTDNLLMSHQQWVITKTNLLKQLKFNVSLCFCFHVQLLEFQAYITAWKVLQTFLLPISFMTTISSNFTFAFFLYKLSS